LKIGSIYFYFVTSMRPLFANHLKRLSARVSASPRLIASRRFAATFDESESPNLPKSTFSPTIPKVTTHLDYLDSLIAKKEQEREKTVVASSSEPSNSAALIANVEFITPDPKPPDTFAFSEQSKDPKELHVDFETERMKYLRDSEVEKSLREEAKTRFFWKHKAGSQENPTFLDIGISPRVFENLKNSGFVHPSKIQHAFIREVYQQRPGVHLVMGAETGSGKTLAYLLPAVDELIESRNILEQEGLSSIRATRICIVSPTVELCQQVASVCRILIKGTNLTVEVNDWNKIPDIIIGTPQIIVQGMDQKVMLRLHHLILDEADKLLEWKGRGGFMDDGVSGILRLAKRVTTDRGLSNKGSGVRASRPLQCFVVGATLARKNLKVFLGVKSARSRLQQQKRLDSRLHLLFQEAVWVQSANLHHKPPGLLEKWVFCRTDLAQRQQLLLALQAHPEQKRILKVRGTEAENKGRTLIFCNKPASVKGGALFLRSSGVKAFEVHEELSADERRHAVNLFIAAENGVLVATDSVCRGMDFPNVIRVIQLEFAKNAAEYLHRIGRTARAGNTGKAINLYSYYDVDLVDAIRNNPEGKRLDSVIRGRARRKSKKVSKKEKDGKRRSGKDNDEIV